MTASHVLFLLVVVVVGLPLFIASRRFNPLRTCPKCCGTGRRGSATAKRVCRTCGGDKEIRRWLAPKA